MAMERQASVVAQLEILALEDCFIVFLH